MEFYLYGRSKRVITQSVGPSVTEIQDLVHSNEDDKDFNLLFCS